MAFADKTDGSRIITWAGQPVRLLVTVACNVGDLLTEAGALADANAGTPAAAHFIAGEKAAANTTITVYREANVQGVTGATAGNPVYLSDTAGGYTETASTPQRQRVGTSVSATEMAVRWDLSEQLRTGQVTSYVAGDDGSHQRGATKGVQALTAGQYAGTANVDVPEYAAATIAFVSATKKITDSANLLAQFKTGDTIVVRGSASNDGVYTVATGNVAAEIVTTQALVDELAGAYVSLCKREVKSNNCVLDTATGLTWARYVSKAKVGAASDGALVWYDAAKAYTLHAADGNLEMVGPNVLRIKSGHSGGEYVWYHVGDVIVCSGFANAVNNAAGYVILSSVANGNDQDLTLQTYEVALIGEVAGGNRDIKLVCDSIWGYCAMANVALVGGCSDWRVPNRNELASLMGAGASGVPDATAFPTWPNTGSVWTSTSKPSDTTAGVAVGFGMGSVASGVKTVSFPVCLVRG